MSKVIEIPLLQDDLEKHDKFEMENKKQKSKVSPIPEQIYLEDCATYVENFVEKNELNITKYDFNE